MDPTYVRVDGGRRRVTLTVTRRSACPYIVRGWGVFQPDKVSPIHEINKLELQLPHGSGGRSSAREADSSTSAIDHRAVDVRNGAQ